MLHSLILHLVYAKMSAGSVIVDLLKMHAKADQHDSNFSKGSKDVIFLDICYVLNVR